MARNSSGRHSRHEAQDGFTLIEVLVALGIAAVAVAVFAGLFDVSYVQYQLNQHRSIALERAQEQVASFHREPEKYTWPAADALKDGDRKPVTIKGDIPQNFGTPRLLPRARMDQTDIANLYREMIWEAFVERSTPEAPHVDVTVIVRWFDNGAPQAVTLSSIVPVSYLEATP